MLLLLSRLLIFALHVKDNWFPNWFSNQFIGTGLVVQSNYIAQNETVASLDEQKYNTLFKGAISP